MNLIKLAPLAALAVVFACDAGSVGPAGDASFSHTGDPNTQLGHWTLCKEGSNATFTIEVDGVPAPDVPLADGACTDVALSPTNPPGNVVVKATEQAAANTVVDSITVHATFIDGSVAHTSVTGQDFLETNANGDKGVTVTFWNTFTPPPPGDEGCTPGFWRNWSANAPGNQSDQWVTYTVGDSYDAVFGVASSLGTLYDAVTAKGGGAYALGRHSVAALLNATSSVDAFYTEAEVIAMVQDAYATGDFDGAKDLLAAANELGCPLP